MSYTPRTDLMVERAPIGLRTNSAFEQSCDLCRTLERELNAANERIKRLEEAGDELQADKQTLLGLLHQMGAKPERLGGVGVGSTNRWINCKEAKP